MDTPKLEWESEEAKKEREIREANRAMDAKTEACFERSWEEDPSVHHDHDSSGRPFRLRGRKVSEFEESESKDEPEQPLRNPQRRQSSRSPRRRNAGQQQRPRRRSGEKPQLRESVRSAPRTRREELKKQLDAIRRIRIYLLAAAVILIVLGVAFALLLNGDSPPPQESSTAVSESVQRGDHP